MIDRQFFPASIIDETAFFLEKAVRSPLTFHVILTLEGEVSSQVIRDALNVSLDLHPKFRCILSDHYPSVKRWFRYSWLYRRIDSQNIIKEIYDPDPAHSSQEGLEYFMENHFTPKLDITEEIPLRLSIIRQKDRVILVFLFHHIAVDGLGALFFVQNFIGRYEDIFYHKKGEETCTPDFRSISQPEIKAPFLGYFSFRHIRNYLKYLNTFLRKPPVLVKSEGGEPSTGGVTVIGRVVSPDQLKKIRSVARKHRVTLNYLILSAMFQAIKRWDQKEDTEFRRIDINVSTNLRSPQDRTLGNFLSGFNISLGTGSINETKEILKMIREKWSFLKENEIARASLDFAWFLKPVPLMFKKFMSGYNLKKSFSPSIALPNLGIYSPNPSHRDEEGFHYLGPARICRVIPFTLILPWPQAAFLIYNDCLEINLTAFRSCLSREDAHKFLDAFIRQLIE